MVHICSWRPALAGCLIFAALACGSSGGDFDGTGGVGPDGGGGSEGSTCDVAACRDLQTCCREILINPVFFQSCNAVALQCNEARCLEVLAGYPRCEQLDL